MSKAVLMSIQPKWCELIASGKKTVEVRKTRPKLETPFKVYIYQTKKPVSVSLIGTGRHISEYDKIEWFTEKSGMVIGEFVCDNINRLVRVGFTGSKYSEYRAVTDNGTLLGDNIFDFACLTKKNINLYLDGKIGYAWHISNLVIYDEPKTLSVFRKTCVNELHCESCAMYNEFNNYCGNKALRLKKPPQSWCYVEELA